MTTYREQTFRFQAHSTYWDSSTVHAIGSIPMPKGSAARVSVNVLVRITGDNNRRNYTQSLASEFVLLANTSSAVGTLQLSGTQGVTWGSHGALASGIIDGNNGAYTGQGVTVDPLITVKLIDSGSNALTAQVIDASSVDDRAISVVLVANVRMILGGVGSFQPVT